MAEIDTPDGKALTFPCPWCAGEIIILVNELACRRFVHGVVKATGQAITPHAPAAECQALIAGDLIWGCGRSVELPASTGVPEQREWE